MSCQVFMFCSESIIILIDHHVAHISLTYSDTDRFRCLCVVVLVTIVLV